MGNMFSIANQVDVDAARIGFHVGFLEALERVGPDPLEALLFNEVDSSNPVEEWTWIGDLPGFEEWKGDRKLSELTAYKFRLENKDWSSGLRVHQNQFKDDRLGLFSGVGVSGLATAARRHRSDLGIQALLNGVDGTAFPSAGNGLAYDGAFFFSTSHSTGGGPAQSNKLTLALSGAALEAAELLLASRRTADGTRSLRLRGTHLIVGPKLEPVARKLMTAELLPSAAGTASESNIHRNRYEVVVTPELTGTYDDWWFLAGLNTPIRPMLFQMREEISTSAIVGNQGGTNDSIPRFSRGELWFGAEARYNVGYFAWQTIVGSIVA